MDIEPLEASRIHSRVKSGEFRAVFSFCRNGPGWLRQCFGKDSPPTCRNSEILGPIDHAMLTVDPHVQGRIYRRLTEIVKRRSRPRSCFQALTLSSLDGAYEG